MEWFARVHNHSLIEPLCEPLKILAQKRVGLFFAYIEQHGFEFVPGICDKRAERLIDEVDIDEPFRDEDAERFHFLHELEKQNLVAGGEFSPFCKGRGYVV